MLNRGKQLTLSDAITPLRVGHDHPRHILQTLQQPGEDELCGIGITPGLNEDIEHNAVLIVTVARSGYWVALMRLCISVSSASEKLT